MATLQSMREQRESIATELTALQNSSADRDWTPEDQTTYDDLMGKHEAVVNRIKRQEAVNEIAAKERAQVMDAEDRKEIKEQPQSAKALYNKWLRNGWEGMSYDEIQAYRNTMSTTTDGEGGYTVQSEVSSDLISKLAAFGGMREVSTILRTDKGNPMNWPTTDGTGEVGEIIAENTAANAADISFDTVALSVYKYSSKVITVPWELMQDSEVNIESVVNDRMVERLARINNTHFTTGDGSSKPRGVVTGSAAGETAAAVSAVTHDELVNLYHSVDPAYRGNASWMMHDNTLRDLRQLADDNGRPLYWSAGGNIADSLGMTLFGRPVTVNQDMPAMTTGLKPILFGDMKKYIIRDVMNVTLFRFTDSAYVKNGQVGFLGWMRTGGNYTDNGASMMHMIMA